MNALILKLVSVCNLKSSLPTDSHCGFEENKSSFTLGAHKVLFQVCLFFYNLVPSNLSKPGMTTYISHRVRDKK